MNGAKIQNVGAGRRGGHRRQRVSRVYERSARNAPGRDSDALKGDSEEIVRNVTILR